MKPTTGQRRGPPGRSRGRSAHTAPPDLRFSRPSGDGFGTGGRLVQLMARRVAREAETGPPVARVPPGALEPAGRAAQEPPSLLELEQRVVPVQSAHGRL